MGNISHLCTSASHRRAHWPSQALGELCPGAWFSLPAPPPAPHCLPTQAVAPSPAAHQQRTPPIPGPDQPPNVLSSLSQARPLSAPSRALPAPVLALAASLPLSSDPTRLWACLPSSCKRANTLSRGNRPSPCRDRASKVPQLRSIIRNVLVKRQKSQ